MTKRFQVFLLALLATTVPASASRTDVDGLKLTATVGNTSSAAPCITVQIENTGSGEKYLPADDFAVPWSAIDIFLSRDGVALAEHIDRTEDLGLGSHVQQLRPGQIIAFVDNYLSNGKPQACIALSRWGYHDLRAGTYRLRASQAFFFKPTQRQDIEETRGLRTPIVTFTISPTSEAR